MNGPENKKKKQKNSWLGIRPYIPAMTETVYVSRKKEGEDSPDFKIAPMHPYKYYKTT